MLEFFRNNKHILGWGIVIFFAATMFSGAFFLRDMFQSSSDRQARANIAQNSPAFLGNIPLNITKYSEFLNQAIAQINQYESGVNPLIAEYLQYNAFSKALRYTILLESAKDSDIVITSRELDSGLQSIYQQYDLKNKKELKALLKENNYPYKEFVDNLQDEMVVNKYTQEIQNEKIVTDEDFDRYFTELRVSHILISFDDYPETALEKANEVVAEINSGELTFVMAAQTLSSDKQSAVKGGDLGWIRFGETFPSFEATAYGLEQGAVSEPVETIFGWHIVQVTDQRILPFPETDEDITQVRNQLQAQLQERHLQAKIQAFEQSHPLEIQDPVILAYHSKEKGDAPKAIGAYQLQISQNPANPVPHFLLSKLFESLKEDEKAFEEYQKGALKSEIGYPLPDIHIELGKKYGDRKDQTNKKAQYQKAIEFAEGSLPQLRKLEGIFTNLKENVYLSQVQAKIVILEAEEVEEADGESDSTTLVEEQ